MRNELLGFFIHKKRLVMIVGEGMIAKAFDRIGYTPISDVVIFASGVSNSGCTDTEEFIREESLLRSRIIAAKSRTIVYFSTSSVDDPGLVTRAYNRHKLGMENIIQQTAYNYTIFRLPIVVGTSKNPYTLINFLFNSIKKKKSFDLWLDATRNVIGVDEVACIVDYIVKKEFFNRQVISIGNPINYKMQFIVHCIEEFVSEKARFHAVYKGSDVRTNISQLMPIYRSLGINFDFRYYLPNLLMKHYAEKLFS